MNQRRSPDRSRSVLSGSLSRRDLLQRTGVAGAAVAAGVTLGRHASAAPGGKAPAFHRGRNQASGEVVVSLKNGIIAQDPTLTGSVSDIAVNFQNYETLIDQPVKAGDFVPVLAESWSNPDELTWEFKLRQGVKFHNDEPFNAEAVKVTMDRWVNPEVGAPMGPILYPTGVIAETVVVDEYTVQIKTAEPFGGLLSSLLLTYMMPAKATADAGTGPIPENIGTGPFRMTEWIKADHLTMEAFDGYWGEKAKIAKLTYRHVPEDATRLAALRAGEIHILDEISADQANVLADDAQKFSTPTQETVESLYPVFNCTTAPFNDVRVRQALNYGIDMKSITEAILGQGAIRQRAPISPQVFAFNDALPQYDYDPDKAKALLAEAGLADGFECTFVVPSDRYPKGRDLAQTIAASAAEIGVTINVEVPEMNVAFSMIRDDRANWQLFQWGISAVNADPDFPLRWFFRTRPEPEYAGTAATTYQNSEVDKLLDEGATTLDPAARAQYYKDAQALIWNEAACLWQHHVVDIYGVSNRISGLVLRPDKRAVMKGVSIQ
jgi:peptide/nickel transport system substrate-binding protein